MRSATAIALELKAARGLIQAQEREIEAAKARLEIERQKVAALAERSQLQAEQSEALESALMAEREAKAHWQELVDELRGRIAKLEESKRKSNRRTIWAALVGIVVGVVAGR